MKNQQSRAIIKGQGLPLIENDVDTDQIIPARFMKCVTFEGLGSYAFYDLRYDESGNLKDHILNSWVNKKGSILIVGKNFGCGSSREHAPQALLKYGIQAIVGESFAEIFAGNCTVLGIPCVQISQPEVNYLVNLMRENPYSEIRIDLEALSLTINSNETLKIHIKPSFRHALISGTWDSTTELLHNKELIDNKIIELPYLTNFQ